METIKYKDLFPKEYVLLKYTEEDLQRAVLAEREKCAELCDEMAADFGSFEYWQTVALGICAETIRARGK